MKAILGRPNLGALRPVKVGGQRLEREDGSSPWRLSKPRKKPTPIELQLLRALAKALPPQDRASLERAITG